MGQSTRGWFRKAESATQKQSLDWGEKNATDILVPESAQATLI